MTDRDELVKLADRLGAIAGRCSYEHDRETIIAATDALRRLASSDGGVKGEPVGYISPATLEALNDPNGSGPIVAAAGYDTVTPVYTAPPADAGMREAVQQAIDEASYLASIHAHHALWRGLLPYGWDAATEQFGRNLAHAISKAIKAELPKRLSAIPAPGATTKSDVGLTPNATTIAAIEELKRGGGEVIGGPSPIPFNGYSEYTPVTVRGSTSDRSSTRSEVTPSLEGDAAERVARIIDPYAWTDLDDMTPTERFVRESRLPWMREDALAKARAILATGLVPDEAAVRADEREKCAARFRGKDIWTGEAIAAAIRSGGGE